MTRKCSITLSGWVCSSHLQTSSGVECFATLRLLFPFPLAAGICAVAALLCRLPPRFPRGISHAARDFSPPARRGGPCKAFEAHGLTALGFFRTSPYRSELLTSLYGKSPALRAELQMFAERGGFEPPILFWSIHAFQACLLSHSSISPNAVAKIRNIFYIV